MMCTCVGNFTNPILPISNQDSQRSELYLVLSSYNNIIVAKEQ